MSKSRKESLWCWQVPRNGKNDILFRPARLWFYFGMKPSRSEMRHEVAYGANTISVCPDVSLKLLAGKKLKSWKAYRCRLNFGT